MASDMKYCPTCGKPQSAADKAARKTAKGTCPDGLITRKEASHLLHCSDQNISHLVTNGELKVAYQQQDGWQCQYFDPGEVRQLAAELRKRERTALPRSNHAFIKMLREEPMALFPAFVIACQDQVEREYEEFAAEYPGLAAANPSYEERWEWCRREDLLGYAATRLYELEEASKSLKRYGSFDMALTHYRAA